MDAVKGDGADNAPEDVPTARFARWVERRPDRIPGEGVIEAPAANTWDRLRSLSQQGCPRVICGFLLDEIPVVAAPDRELLEYATSRVEFAPLLVAEDCAGVGSGCGLLCVTDRAKRARAVETLAGAIASATGRERRSIDVSSSSDEELAAAIGAAEVVFNDVGDWSLGFAVDEFAARLGRQCVRFGHPGYSPLRFGLLGLELVNAQTVESPRIRSLVRHVLSSRAVTEPRRDVRSWFLGPQAATRWRAIWRSGRVAELLTPVPVHARERDQWPISPAWLYRDLAWAVLHGSGDDGLFPEPAQARAVGQATDWLISELRAAAHVFTSHPTIPRWLRLHPEWLEQLRQQAGSGRDTRTVIGNWITGALLWGEGTTPIGQLIEGAGWAAGDDPMVEPWPLIRAWWSEWGQLPNYKDRLRSLHPAWRPVLVDVGHASLRGEHSRGTPGEIDAVLGDSELWEISFGRPGRVMQVAAALSDRRWALVRRAWRQATSVRGVARLWRGAFADRAECERWLRAVQAEAAKFGLGPLLVRRWATRRNLDLWRVRPGEAVQRDLSVALRIMEQEANAGNPPVWVRSWHATLLAFGGEPAAAIARVLASLPSHRPETAVSSSLVALALWCRGRATDAAQLLAMRAGGGGPGWAIFLRAVCWQLLGETAACEQELRELQSSEMNFFTAASSPQARWFWMSVVWQQAGERELAERMHARADAAGCGHRALLDEIPVRVGSIAAGWPRT